MPMNTDKDACALLDADHIAVKHLFVEYARQAMLAASPEAAPASDERLALASKICDELTVHALIEEEIFYPALQEAVPDTADQIEEGRAEHQEAKEMIAELRTMTAADEEMDDLVAELSRAIEHHVKEERDELFPKAKASSLDLMALGVQLRERQLVLEKEPAPAA